ncbi:diguanylate cyclase domain-containing protein [Aliikangiella coralliicola]|uniref:diguanylate cyclase n=1 Tax=Aliikangiella coralliicola TaxID=2592383 RepID=A0A545UIM9_9GAMM|nr:diguanylate cyclase [Aliikangiella coralliicola]TQV89322.1 diguanylate cyclase [Aliikangiella coralliicola]
MNVLLVEDSPTLRFQLTRFIEEAGHSVIAAESGEIAIQLVEEQGADLVICDVDMPGLNGYETVPIIRESLGEYWIPIIFITGREQTEDFVLGFKAGADDYLVKPVQKDILHMKIQVMERFILMQRQLKALKEDAKRPNQYDPLTHVYSQSYFQELSTLHWSILSRQQLPASFLIVDVDYYQSYVEYYGEQAGELCLKQVANAIHSSVQRPGDLVGRFQDDHFIVMLPDTGDEGSEHVAERIRQTVESLTIEHKPSKAFGVVSVSIGGSTSYRVRSSSLELIVELAYESLQWVKRKGGNKVEILKAENIENISIEKS